jgi:hypothetical protein
VILDDSQRWFARNTWRIKVGDGGGEICSDQISATHSGGDLVVVEGDGKGIRDFNGKIFRCNNSNKVRINNRHGSNKLEVWKTQWGKVKKGVTEKQTQQYRPVQPRKRSKNRRRKGGLQNSQKGFKHQLQIQIRIPLECFRIKGLFVLDARREVIL